MTMLVIIALSAFIASSFTFFSGFGLGTLLMPVIAIFLPLEMAIALTALVHLAHNGIKCILLFTSVHWKIFLKFGIPALITAFVGALLLTALSEIPPIGKAEIFFIPLTFTYLKIIIGVLLIVSSNLEWWIEKKKKQTVSNASLFLGGALSGFFGGLSGHQGAFRSLFLIHMTGKPKDYIATNAAIACVVDISRIIIYATLMQRLFQSYAEESLVAIGAAILGLGAGWAILGKITFKAMRLIVFIFINAIAFLLIIGMI